MIASNHITLYGLERKNNDDICDLCEAGHPREVLAQIKTSGFDCEILKKKVFIRETSPIPVHPWRHPFLTACSHRNYPVVQLLLELGADPDAECCAMTVHKTPRQTYANTQQLQELFEGGKLWWKVQYPEEKKRTLHGELEQNILAGKASEALWLMMHGVKLTTPNILATVGFGRQSKAFKELICGMGIPTSRRQEFHAQLMKNSADANVLDILYALLQTNGNEGRIFAENLLHSLELLPEEKVNELTRDASTVSERIGILKHLINAYTASEHQSFIEKNIAMLLKEILSCCMPV